MNISVIESQIGEVAQWTDPSLNHHQLCKIWESGGKVAAQQKRDNLGRISMLVAANALMVRIDLTRIPVEVALSAAFTQQYCSVAAWGATQMGDELLLAFELPTQVTSKRTLGLLMQGLEMIFAGALHQPDVLAQYGLDAVTKAEVVGRKLDVAAVTMLEQLGHETRVHNSSDGAYMRSRHRLHRSMSVTLASGESVDLEQLHPQELIFCPVHVDATAKAFVHWYEDGTVGVQCDHCQRTYAELRANHQYSFDHFDHVVAELSAQQCSIVKSGVEYDGDGITTFAERYLPADAIVCSITNVLPDKVNPDKRINIWKIPKEVPGKLMLPDLSKTHFEVLEGVTMVKSPKGTNKTGALEELVAECKREHLGVLVIGHRRSLMQSMAKRLKIDCYFTVDDDSDGDAPSEESKSARFTFVDPKAYYAVCLDSIVRLDPQDKNHQYPVVIIDESEQVFTHLVGDTIKSHRREVYAKLRYYLRAARQVVMLDADLNMITMDTAFAVFDDRTPTRFIINKPVMQRGLTWMYSSNAQLVHQFGERVRKGEKVYAATNSRNKAMDLQRIALQKNPKARVAVITSRNSQTQGVHTLMKNLCHEFEHNLDVLIASPAIGTGIDITFKDEDGNSKQVVDSVFGFFEGNVVTHFDIDQQLLRVRDPGQVHVWVDGRPMDYEVDIDCIKQELEKSVRKTYCLLRYDDDGSPVYADDGGVINIWARVLAASRGSKNRLAEQFRALRANDGWILADVETDKDQAELGRFEVNAAKESRQQEREQQLLAAEQLTREDAEELREKSGGGQQLTDAEQIALERYQIEQFYCEDEITQELVQYDDNGRKRKEIQSLERVVCNPGWYANMDKREIADDLLAFDRRRFLVQREVLESVFAASGLFDLQSREFSADAVVSAGDLGGFMAEVEARAVEIDMTFGIQVYADGQRKPITQLKGLLKQVGLNLELVDTRQKDGKKTRLYGIAGDELTGLMEVVGRRDVRFRRESAASSKDKVGKGTTNKLAAYLVLKRQGQGKSAGGNQVRA
jgi:hypothetical protein